MIPEYLYQALSPYSCASFKSNCTDCCGCVTVNRAELQQITDYLKINNIDISNTDIIQGEFPKCQINATDVLEGKPADQWEKCTILSNKKNCWWYLFKSKPCRFSKDGCLIYPVRPLICRMFGGLASLKCPHGFKFEIPEAVEIEISVNYETNKRVPLNCIDFSD